MSARSFVDTNILIYAIEPEGVSAGKSTTARTLLRRDDLCLSTQVLAEFYRATTSRRRISPLTHAEAVSYLQLWKRFPVEPVTVAHVDLAVEMAGETGISYFDAQIVAAARFAGCETLYSEDLNDGQIYRGVRVLNPFAAAGSNGAS